MEDYLNFELIFEEVWMNLPWTCPETQMIAMQIEENRAIHTAGRAWPQKAQQRERALRGVTHASAASTALLNFGNGQWQWHWGHTCPTHQNINSLVGSSAKSLNAFVCSSKVGMEPILNGFKVFTLPQGSRNHLPDRFGYRPTLSYSSKHCRT